MIRVGINGFGRIGKMILKAAVARGLLGTVIDIAAVADQADDGDYYAYQLKYDSIRGTSDRQISSTKSDGKLTTDDLIVIDGHSIQCIPAAGEPALLPWKKLEIDCVMETTGLFAALEKAQGHLHAGAKKVILSNSAEDRRVKTIIMGVNDHEYDPDTDHIISGATCTANCIIPLIHILLKSGVGIEKGHLTVLLPHTASRKIVDSNSTKGRRDGRSAAVNIIPSMVYASRSIGEVFPPLKGRIDDVVFRVPVAVVSLIDFSFTAERDTSIAEIDGAIKEAAATYLKGIAGVTADEIVSSDVIGDPHSALYDSCLTLHNNLHEEKRFFRIFAWYDNEWGYANRMIDFITKISLRK
jgi:glyceraldehyde 3-phosphate dehydrogenase